MTDRNLREVPGRFGLRGLASCLEGQGWSLGHSGDEVYGLIKQHYRLVIHSGLLN